MRIAMIGGGYVGLVSGACFAEFGTDVTVVEADARKLAALHEGRMPIYEPGLDKLVAENVSGRPAGLHRRSRRRGARCRGGVHRRRHADAARRRPRRPDLCLCRRRAGGARADRLRGDRHQIDRAGRHQPAHRGDRPHHPAGPGLRRGLQSGVPARGQRDRRLHAAGPRGDRRRERPRARGAAAGSIARSI